MADSGILKDVGMVINKALGLQGGQTYEHMTTCLLLSGQPPKKFDGKALISSIFKRVEVHWSKVPPNLRKQRPESKNWLHERPVRLSSDPNKREVTLERLIAAINWPDSEKWVYQVPTASGLTDSKNGKKRSIDLVHWSKKERNWYEFIELKVNKSGGTPLFAGMEILLYGLLYLFSRSHAKELGYDLTNKPILRAAGIHLQVLAPVEYYDEKRIQLDWFEDEINEGLKCLIKEQQFHPLSMDFEFQQFPPTFPPDSLPNDPIAAYPIIAPALENRSPVYRK